MANTFMRFPGGRSRCLTLSYDDGVIQDERLIGLMKQYGLRGTFNVNSGCWADRDYDDSRTTHRRMTLKRAQKLYTESGFEVALHAVSHPNLEQLPVNVCTAEILDDRRSLEQEFGMIVRGAAYPFGTYNDSVLRSLEACGVVFCRTVNSTHDFRLPDNWLILNPTCHHADAKLPELTDAFLGAPAWGSKAPRFFYLWGHSYEFDFQDNWNIIETFADRISGKDDIWYSTNIEAYDYIRAYKSLVFSTDLGMVHNPSAQTVYFVTDSKAYEVAPGQTLKL